MIVSVDDEQHPQTSSSANFTELLMGSFSFKKQGVQYQFLYMIVSVDDKQHQQTSPSENGTGPSPLISPRINESEGSIVL